MQRRVFLRLAGAAGAGLLWTCASRDVSAPPPPEPVALLPPPLELGSAGVSVAISQWPDGADAAAMVSVDDFCQVNLGPAYDFGGSWAPYGGLASPTSDPPQRAGQTAGESSERFLLSDVLGRHPGVKVTLNTITAMRQDPRSFDALPAPHPLSDAPAWDAVVKGLQSNCPGLSLGWHGYSHYNSDRHSSEEFLQYDSNQTRRALDAMEYQGQESGLTFNRAFRPPGWATTPQLLEELARRGYTLLDNSQMPTFASFRPGYILTPQGRALFAISTSFTLPPSAVLGQNGLWVLHFHMTAPNSNAVFDESVRDAALQFIEQHASPGAIQLAWLSPEEVRAAYDAAARVRWTASLSGTRVTISITDGTALARGITWMVAGGASDVVLDAGTPGPQWTVVDRSGTLKLVVTG